MKQLSFFRNGRQRRGQGLVEYILMVFLIGLLVYAAVKGFGGKVQSAFDSAGTGLDSAVKSGTAAQ